MERTSMTKLSLRKYLLLIICFVVVDCSYAQSTKEKLKRILISKQLKVGDKMPNISLGEVMNNHTGKTRFSDFNGKLVILDFWSTTCSTCFELFPHMEKIQKQFGDSIQIFLVNGEETKEKVEKTMTLRKRKKSKAILPDDLPVIVNAKYLMELFPHFGDPHHVWIDGKGIIRIRGNQLNTYEEKIRDLLAGKKVFSMNDESGAPSFDKDKPYLINQSKKKPVQFGSLITGYDNNYAVYGGSAEGIADTVAGTIRNTLVNTSVLDLYFTAFQNQLAQNYHKQIYSNKNGRIDYFLLLVKDTLRYTSQFIETQEEHFLTDKEYMKSSYCYEQVSPIDLSEDIRKEYMITDLNRYFENLYGTEATLEKRKIQCFVLVRTSGEEKFVLKPDVEKSLLGRDIKNIILYDNMRLKDAVASLIYPKSFFIDSLIQNKNGLPTLVLDETGFTRKTNFILPDISELENIEDIKTALNPFGLDIIKVDRNIEFVVIREKDRND